MFKVFKKLFKFFAIFSLIAVFAFSNVISFLPQILQNNKLAENLKVKEAQAVASGDAKIFYSISGNTTPRTRDYISSSNSFNTAVTTVAGATALQSVIKASPTRDEMIAGYVNSAGTLQVMCWNGASWTNEWSVAAGGTGTNRRFDIAYETATGDVIVAYSRNVAATNAVDYRTKPGSTGCGTANWATAASMPTTTALTTGTVYWVKAAWDRRAAQNLIAVIWTDSNSDLGASIWSGTAFGNFPTTAQMEQSLEVVAAAGDVEDFDVEYESTSGDVMMVWANSAGANGTNGAFYNVCTGGTSTCAWGTRTAMPTVTDDATHLDISADPNSNSILYGAIGNAGSDLTRGVWSGTAWTNTANADTATAAPLAGTKFVATGWLISGANTRGVLVYYDSGATNIGWQTVSGTTWTAQTDWAPTPVFGVQENYKIEMDPINKDRLIFSVNDANSDIFAKRLILSGTTFTWSNADGGAALEANTGSATYRTFDFAYNRFIPAPTNNLTIGVTAGSKTATVNSGDTSVYANDTSCSGPSSCAAFTLNVSNTSVTVGSIKITETGTANATADLSQLALFYDTDGDYSNGVTGQYGATVASFTSEAATVSGSLALTAATTYYFYARFNASSAASSYPKGGQTVDFQIAANADVTLSSGTATNSGAPVTLAGTTTILPKLTSVTYGSGLSDGARSSEAITISGYGFGVAPGGSRANCSGAVDTGCVRFLVGGAATVADTDVSSWSNTSIGWTASSTLATLGGASSLEVVSGAQGTATDTTYYIYPNITALVATSTNAAREYDSGDVDGLVMLQGDHFGSVQGTVAFTGAFGGGGATIHATVEGACSTGGWSASGYSGNTVCIEATPASIPDSVYSGTITLTRNSDSKTHTAAPTFFIMPRIISNTPTNGIVADVIQVLGNHFCQSGTCPVSPNRSDTSNNVKFGSTQALDGDFVNQTGGAGACNGAGAAWTHTEICVKVPAGITAGSQPTKARTNATYDSNTKAFTVNSVVPNDPTNLNQYKDAGLTQTIAVGGVASATPIYLKQTMEVPGISGGTLYPQFEYKLTGTAFSCSGGGACAVAAEGAGSAGPGPATGSLAASPADGAYHWQARTRHNKSGTDYYSNWVPFGGNFETDTDFSIDIAAPVISNVLSSNVQTNSATITWDTNEAATSQVQYNTTGTFVNNCAANNDCTTLDAALVSGHSVNLANLNSGTTYYYRVRSKDQAGNEAISSNYTFVTSSVTQPAKTTTFFVIGATSTISGATTATSSFSVFMPENATSTKSILVIIKGIYDTTGSLPNKIKIQVNSETEKIYAIPTGSANKSGFKIIHKVNAINIDPGTNILYITPETNTSISISSAEMIVTYSYTP